MLPVLTSSAMREADRFTIEELGIAGFTLMESAGRGAADEIARRLGGVSGKRILIVCGKGNNGGDGLVIARILSDRGAECLVTVPGPPEALSDDAARNLRILMTIAERTGRLSIREAAGPGDLADAPRADAVIDALLGTGLSEPLRPPLSDWVDFINGQAATRVAIDVPTGLNSDSGKVMGSAVRADLTVTMGALKAGLLIEDGLSRSGAVHTVEIGIPRYVLDRAAGSEGCGYLPELPDIAALLPERPAAAHKYSVGLVLSITGSRDYPGAAFMASTSAARIGAGAVICATASGIRPLLQQKFTEVMVQALPETEEGSISDDAVDRLIPLFDRAKSIVTGCGLGRHPKTQAFVRKLLEEAGVPAVIDADGLNALAGHLPGISGSARGRWILTPHMGEFRRLAGEEATGGFVNPLQVVSEYARRWSVVLLLKGNPAFVGTPSGPAYLVPGHSALASAGTGDVLAGACAGLLAQGLEPEHAALCALSVGREAALRYAARRDPSTMLAGDVIAYIPGALQSISRKKDND